MHVSSTLCWVLIGAGALDLVGWFLRGYGWTNLLFGDNLFTQYGPWALIAVGISLLRHQSQGS
jgi:hypothetical protein